MISDDRKSRKIDNKLLFDEISRKAKSKSINNEKTLKTPNVSNNKLPVSPYSNNSPKIRSPIIARTPNKLATSPYHKEKCLRSPKTPKSPFAIKSPYKIESPYSSKKDPWVYNPTINERFTKIIGID